MKQFITIFSIIITSCIILILFGIIPLKVLSQDMHLAVKVTKDNRVVRLKTDLKETREIYRTDKYKTLYISVSPNNRYLAFIEETKPEYTRDGYSVKPEYSLVILDDAGKLINRIDKMDVQKYVWSPDGEKIAFLTFDPGCESQYRCPTGAFVYNIITSELKKIAERAKEINWLFFDSTVLLYDLSGRVGIVTRWNPRTEKLDTTEFKDIYFSPDGKYYLCLYKDDLRPIQLYNSETNHKEFDIKISERRLPSDDTSDPFPKDIGSLWSSHDLVYPYGWVFNTGHFLLFIKTDVITKTVGEEPVKRIISQKVINEKNYIYDPEQRKVVKEFEGSISSWVGNGSQILVERDGKVILEGLP